MKLEGRYSHSPSSSPSAALHPRSSAPRPRSPSLYPTSPICRRLPVMQSASSSTTSPTRTLFNLPEPQSIPTVPAASHPRASITRSSMATTLGGHIEGAQGADIEKLSSKAGLPPGGLHVPGRAEVSNDGRRPLWSRYMMRKTKNHLVAALSEFVGTTLFLLLAFGGTVRLSPASPHSLYEADLPCRMIPSSRYRMLPTFLIVRVTS